MNKLFLFIILFFLVISCKKLDQTFLISNHVSTFQYYDKEIFNKTNLAIYGKWKFLYYFNKIDGYIYSSVNPYLEVVKYGIYGKINDNKIVEIGKIIVLQQDSSLTRVFFTPDDLYTTNLPLPNPASTFRFNGNDTLILEGHEIDKSGYYYLRIR